MKLPMYTDEEIREHTRVWREKTKYPATINKAIVGFSKAGNEMATIDLQVNCDNQSLKIKKFLVYFPKEVGNKKHYSSVERIKKFIEILGMPYKEDSFDRIGITEGECLRVTLKANEKGYAEIDQMYSIRDTGSAYSAPVAPPVATDELDDDIPF